MGRVFGTDGVRGLANAELTAELALDLAFAAACVLSDRSDGSSKRRLSLAWLPRASMSNGSASRRRRRRRSSPTPGTPTSA